MSADEIAGTLNAPIFVNTIRNMSTSSDFIGRRRGTLVFYTCVKSCTSLAVAFVRDWRRSMSHDEIAGNLNAPIRIFKSNG